MVKTASLSMTDRTKNTERMSLVSDGRQGDSHSEDPSTSEEGRYVALESVESRQVALDPGGHNIFLHDRQTGKAARASVASHRGQANDGSSDTSIGSQGRYVALMLKTRAVGFLAMRTVLTTHQL